MVLFKTALTGIAILLLGIVVVFVVAPNLTFDIQEVQQRWVEPHAEFLVGDLVDRPYDLPATTNVAGTVTITEAPSNKTSDITFLVFDSGNYQQWTSGGQAESSYSESNQASFNFTFKTETGGVYHFVFDNRVSVYKKYVILTIAYDEVTIKKVPDSRVGYIGWALAIIGAILLVYGAIRRPPVTWA